MYKLSVRSFIFLLFLVAYIQETISWLSKQIPKRAIQISNHLANHSLKSFILFRELQSLYRSTFKGSTTSKQPTLYSPRVYVAKQRKALSSHGKPTMTQPHSKGEPRCPAEPKPAPSFPKSSKAVQLHSLPPTKAAQSAATTRWLNEKPRQEYWNPVARISISSKAVSKV